MRFSIHFGRLIIVGFQQERVCDLTKTQEAQLSSHQCSSVGTALAKQRLIIVAVPEGTACVNHLEWLWKTRVRILSDRAL